MSARIAASLISLNESEHIGRAVASLAGLAGVIYLVDGGSTDDTIEIARATAKRNSIDLVFREVLWDNDFSAQRNRCLDLALVDGRPLSWLIRLDCDEKLPVHAKVSLSRILPDLPDSVLCGRVRQVNLLGNGNFYSADRGGWETWPRIFRAGPLWKWVGHVHEHVTLSGREVSESQVADISIPVVHYGWLSEERRREREALYGLTPGELTNRKHVVRPTLSYYR